MSGNNIKAGNEYSKVQKYNQQIENYLSEIPIHRTEMNMLCQILHFPYPEFERYQDESTKIYTASGKFWLGPQQRKSKENSMRVLRFDDESLVKIYEGIGKGSTYKAATNAASKEILRKLYNDRMDIWKAMVRIKNQKGIN